MSPLFYGNTRRAQHQHAFFDLGGCCDTGEGFAGAAGEDDDAGAGAAIPKHLRQSSLLIITDNRRRLHLYLQPMRLRVPHEIVLFYQGELVLFADAFYVFDVAGADLDRSRLVMLHFFIAVLRLLEERRVRLFVF